jgi:hypothetical protein
MAPPKMAGVWKNPSQEKAGGMAQGVSPEFKTQYQKLINYLIY